jgi:hypothetical protein
MNRRSFLCLPILSLSLPAYAGYKRIPGYRPLTSEETARMFEALNDAMRKLPAFRHENVSGSVPR